MKLKSLYYLTLIIVGSLVLSACAVNGTPTGVSTTIGACTKVGILTLCGSQTVRSKPDIQKAQNTQKTPQSNTSTPQKSPSVFDKNSIILPSENLKLGEWVAEAFRVRMQADIALINAGNFQGINPEIAFKSLNKKRITNLFEQKLKLVSVHLNANEFGEYLQTILKNNTNPKAFAYVATNDGGNFSNTNNAKTYRIALPENLAQGAQGYPDLQQHDSFRKTLLKANKVWEEYLALALAND